MTPLHIQPLAQVAVSSLLNSLPEGFLVAVFAWATLRLLPRQNSRTRFAVWFLALLAVAVLPILGELSGGLSQGRSLGTLKGERSALVHPFASTGIPSAINLPVDWAPYILLIWLLVALAIMTRLAVGLWRLRQLRQSCAPVDVADLDPALGRTITELTSKAMFAGRPVTIATSGRIHVPAALGLWKPIIVLPTWALEELPPLDLGIILRHEFAHLERWDDWTNLVQKIVRALFFFHPAVWWIEKRLSVEREMACDDVVVAQTDNPTGYASCLVSLLERSLTERGWTMAQALVHRAREASLRLARILDGNRPTATQLSKCTLGMVGAFTLLCLVVLPYAPQVVAFEQNPQRITADHEYSTALAQPSMSRSSYTLPATFLQLTSTQTSVRPVAVVPASLSARNPAPKGEDMLAQGVSPGSARETIASPRETARTLAQTRATCDHGAETSSGFSGRGDARRTIPGREGADSSTIAAAAEAVIEANALGRNIQPVLPTLVFVQATQYVESDLGSRYMVWRIQVWRLTVVNQRKAQAPVAHST